MSSPHDQPWWSSTKHRLKNIRNDWMLHRYLAQQASDEKSFKAALRGSLGQLDGPKNLLCIVAFERPEAIDLCLSGLKLFLTNAAVAVFDNSRSDKGRALITKVCKEHQIPYLALPPQSTTHANRSHGMAMSWIFERVIKDLGPDQFGFIDHDLIALGPVDPFAPLKTQPVYGCLNQGKRAWNLWAGYCFYRLSEMQGKKINFLYDFSRELDTGGRNWTGLYQFINNETLVFPSDRIEHSPNLPEVENPVQLIDKNWLHVGGVSYNNNLNIKQSLLQALVAHLNQLENQAR
jgi:hypothetical protein